MEHAQGNKSNVSTMSPNRSLQVKLCKSESMAIKTLQTFKYKVKEGRRHDNGKKKDICIVGRLCQHDRRKSDQLASKIIACIGCVCVFILLVLLYARYLNAAFTVCMLHSPWLESVCVMQSFSSCGLCTISGTLRA